jgi:hypothetical protein
VSSTASSSRRGRDERWKAERSIGLRRADAASLREVERRYGEEDRSRDVVIEVLRKRASDRRRTAADRGQAQKWLDIILMNLEVIDQSGLLGAEFGEAATAGIECDVSLQTVCEQQAGARELFAGSLRHAVGFLARETASPSRIRIPHDRARPIRRVHCGGRRRPRARRVVSRSAGGGCSGDPDLGDDPPGEPARRPADGDVVIQAREAVA